MMKRVVGSETTLAWPAYHGSLVVLGKATGPRPLAFVMSQDAGRGCTAEAGRWRGVGTEDWAFADAHEEEDIAILSSLEEHIVKHLK